MIHSKYNFLYSFLDIIENNNIGYWLEGGTALAAYRDGKIFPWEHDFDVGIWKSDLIKKLPMLKSELKKINCSIVIQKNYLYVDNLIQIYSEDNSQNPNQIDIYLYTKKNNHAYMRWFHNPEGRLGFFIKSLFFLTNKKIRINNNKHPKNIANYVSALALKPLFYILFNFLFYFCKCRYHCFPDYFFTKKKSILFCGRNMLISFHIDEFLTYRYGEKWKTPDDNFNQSGKWKKSLARPIHKLNLIPKIDIKYSLHKND